MTKSGYYKNSAEALGWGERDAKIDRERLTLLDEYVEGKILDIGCGYGLYVDWLSSRGFDCYGIDFTDEFINVAKRKRKGHFIKGKAEKLPFRDKEFDTVILFDILEHGEDRLILSEAKRVATKRILIIVPRTVDPSLANSGVIFRHYLDKSHLREYAEQNLEDLAKKSDLEILKIKRVHPLYNETVFMELFEGSVILKKIIRKIVLLLLPKKNYPTELFAAFNVK